MGAENPKDMHRLLQNNKSKSNNGNFQFSVECEEGINLYVDLSSSSPSQWIETRIGLPSNPHKKCLATSISIPKARDFVGTRKIQSYVENGTTHYVLEPQDLVGTSQNLHTDGGSGDLGARPRGNSQQHEESRHQVCERNFGGGAISATGKIKIKLLMTSMNLSVEQNSGFGNGRLHTDPIINSSHGISTTDHVKYPEKNQFSNSQPEAVEKEENSAVMTPDGSTSTEPETDKKASAIVKNLRVLKTLARGPMISKQSSQSERRRSSRLVDKEVYFLPPLLFRIQFQEDLYKCT